MNITVHPDYSRLKEYLGTLPERFETEGELLYRGRNTIKRFDADGVSLVIKKYKVPNPINRVVYTLWKDKATRSYDNAARLRSLGIGTPHEIALIRPPRTQLFDISYFVSAYTPDPPLAEILDADNPLAEGSDTRRGIEAFAAFTAELHRQGVEHRDYNRTNILFRKEDGGFRFSLIDNNRMRFFNTLPRKRCWESLARLDGDPAILRHVAHTYARARGWDPDDVERGMRVAREAFLIRRERKARFKQALGLAKK